MTSPLSVRPLPFDVAHIENASTPVSYAQAFYVRFHCEHIDCQCDVDVRVRGCVSEEGGRLYEYSSSKCPRCGHPLLRGHQLVGDVGDRRVRDR